MCPTSEFWCQALLGYCQVIPGEEVSSLYGGSRHACLQEMQDMGGTKGGVHMRGQIGRQEERGLAAEGWRFPDSAVNNKM